MTKPEIAQRLAALVTVSLLAATLALGANGNDRLEKGRQTLVPFQSALQTALTVMGRCNRPDHRVLCTA